MYRCISFNCILSFNQPTVTADTTPLMKGGSEDGDNDIQDYEVPPEVSTSTYDDLIEVIRCQS